MFRVIYSNSQLQKKPLHCLHRGCCKHKEANVLILLSTGVYLLASVNAPQRSCKTYLSDKDTAMQVDVVDIMKVTQQSACWCEL